MKTFTEWLIENQLNIEVQNVGQKVYFYAVINGTTDAGGAEVKPTPDGGAILKNIQLNQNFTGQGIGKQIIAKILETYKYLDSGEAGDSISSDALRLFDSLKRNGYTLTPLQISTRKSFVGYSKFPNQTLQHYRISR